MRATSSSHTRPFRFCSCTRHGSFAPSRARSRDARNESMNGISDAECVPVLVLSRHRAGHETHVRLRMLARLHEEAGLRGRRNMFKGTIRVPIKHVPDLKVFSGYDWASNGGGRITVVPHV